MVECIFLPLLWLYLRHKITSIMWMWICHTIWHILDCRTPCHYGDKGYRVLLSMKKREDSVVLKLCRPHDSQHRMEDDSGDYPLEAAAMGNQDWDAVRRKCSNDNTNVISIRAPVPVLSEHSSYFRSLFSNFREAESEQVTVSWDLQALCLILQNMFTGHLQIAPSNVTSLLEGAMFFGAENIIAECESWAALQMAPRMHKVDYELLKHIPHIWAAACEIGYSPISSLCPQYLAINFEDVATSDFLEDLPCPLLSACIDHPMLTVSSEKRLCEAILRWHDSHRQTEYSLNLLKKVRLGLLSLEYIVGSLAGNSSCILVDEAIILVNEVAMTPGNFSLRLTQYSKALDLDGCQQITDHVLFASVLHSFLDGSSLYSDATSAGAFLNYMVNVFPSLKGRNELLSHVQRPSMVSSHSPHSQSILTSSPVLGNLQKLLLGKCWRLGQGQLIPWLRMTCSNLEVLGIPHCPQISISLLSFLASTCPLIEAVDLSMDISFLHNATVEQSHVENIPCAACGRGSWGTLLHLAELSLAGRSEVSDSDLILISAKCPCISAITLSGCRSLTDSGIAVFLQNHRSLNLLHAAYTAFGVQSLRAFLPTSSEENSSLNILSLDDCLGLSEEGLVQLLSYTRSLKALSLCNTNLTDDGLFMFHGSSLESLNVQGTRVSGTAIAHALRRNVAMKYLNFRDCKRAFLDCQGACEGMTQLLELSAGWGFSHVFSKVTFPCLRTLTLGLGANVSNSFLFELPMICPSLGELSLCLQDICNDGLAYIITSLQNLRILMLQQSLQPLSNDFVDVIVATGNGSNLISLKLEGVCPLLTNHELISLGKACKNLRHFSLLGCQALNTDSLDIITHNWPGLVELKLEDCNEVTSQGAASLFQLYGLEILVLRHNGACLSRSFIADAARQLLLLRCISLDLCDAMGGFDTPQASSWRSISTIKIARCTFVKCPFHLEAKRRVHKQTIVLECDKYTLRTSIVKERI